MQNFEQIPSDKPPENVPNLEELREKLNNPKYLPKLEEFSTYFRDKDRADEWREYIEKSPNDSNEGIPVDENARFEVLTREYVLGLARYLEKRATEFRATPENPLKILEIGSGNGRLSHFLRLADSKSKLLSIQATDSGEMGIKPIFPVETVRGPHGETEGLSPIREALKKYKPDIIVSSWMPYKKDWTVEFRKTPTVKEYIVIGDPDCCGLPWETWGQKDIYGVNYEKSPDPKKYKPPYKRDGFTGGYLKSVQKYQLSRSDFPGDRFLHSRTAVFRRISDANV